MNELTIEENDSLLQCENIIDAGLKTFVDVGNALAKIRGGKLYRLSHGTFEDYCQDRWGIARRSAYQMIAASVTVENVRNCAQTPTTESQARPLTPFNDKPELQNEIWEKAVETAPNGKITAKHVESVVNEYREEQREARIASRTPAPQPQPTMKKNAPRLIVGRAENCPEIPSSSVDIIITSPPYNLGKQSWPMGGKGRKRWEDGIGYDSLSDEMSPAQYVEWQMDVFNEMWRVAKDGASFFYNHKTRNQNGELIHPMDWIRHEYNPWTLRQEIVWDRTSTHNHSAVLFWPEDERIYWMTKGKPTLPNRPIGMSTVWRFHGPTPNTWHPAPFNRELPARCLDAVGIDGANVLDPFCGSGTTLDEAVKRGYNATGIDISETYISKIRGEYTND